MIFIERTAADGLSKRGWVFTLVSQAYDEAIEVRLHRYTELERASKRHTFKRVRKWDSMDERSYNSEVRRRELEALTPEDVRAEALAAIKVTIVIPKPTKDKP
jgi:hypothetical protein